MTELPKARENAGDQVVLGCSFASDWLRKWHEVSAPITEQSKATTEQSKITFEIVLVGEHLFVKMVGNLPW